MPGCAVATCKNTNRKTKGTDVKYFSFPQDEELAKLWIQACRREDKINVKHARVCSVHFATDSFEIPLRQRLLQYNPKNSRNLKFDAVPALYLCTSLPRVKSLERTDRSNKRTQHKPVTEAVNESLPDFQETATNVRFLLDESNVEPMAAINVKTNEETKHGTNELGELRKRIENLEKKNAELLQQVRKYENALAEVFTPQQGRIHPLQRYVPTVLMKLIESGSELTCKIPGTHSSNQQLTGRITAHIKQEAEDDQCPTEMRDDNCGNLDVLLTKLESNDVQECSTSLNCGTQSSFNEDKDRTGNPTKPLTPTVKPVKNEEDQHLNEPWSVFSGSISIPIKVKQEEE